MAQLHIWHRRWCCRAGFIFSSPHVLFIYEMCADGGRKFSFLLFSLPFLV